MVVVQATGETAFPYSDIIRKYNKENRYITYHDCVSF